MNQQISSQVLEAFNSLETVVIFQIISNSGRNGIDTMSLGRSALRLLTRKRFYLRIAALKQAGLISMIGTIYTLTSLGLVIRDSLRITDQGIMFKLPLRTLDAEEGAKQKTF